jgi:hypothetical protein
VVLDAFSRLFVGWSIDSSQTLSPAVNVLGMSIENRQAEIKQADRAKPRAHESSPDLAAIHPFWASNG